MIGFKNCPKSGTLNTELQNLYGHNLFEPKLKFVTFSREGPRATVLELGDPKVSELCSKMLV